MEHGMDAEDVADSRALYKRNDWMDFVVEQEVKAFEEKGYYLVEIVGLVERLVHLETCHYVRVLIASSS